MRITLNRLIYSIAIVASLALSDRADLPPFPSPEQGMKRVPCEYVAQSDRHVLGYRFFLFERRRIPVFQEKPALGLGQVEKLPGSYDDDDWMGILAMPEQLGKEYPIYEYLTLLLQDKEDLPRGVALHTIGRAMRDLPESDPRTEIKSLITISVDKEGRVKITATDWPHAPGQNPTTKVIPIAFTILAGLALAGAMIAGGIWFFRRQPKS